MFESRTFEIFHGDEGAALVFASIVNGADIGVIERGGGFGFALKTCQGLGIFGEFAGKKFKSDETVQAGVLGFINHAHSATTQFFDDAVVGNRLAQERIGAWHLRTY